LLTRNTVRYCGPTIEEKIIHGAQRACTVFAVSALMLCLFDLANIRSVEGAAAFFNDNRARVAELPDRIRSGIEFISFEQDTSVTVAIPREAVKTAASAVARLAAVRHEDAVAFAMTQPRGKSGSNFGSGNLIKSELRVADTDPLSALATAPIHLASVDMDSVPSETAPMSLPMSAAIPLGMVPMPRPAPGVPPPSPAERLHLQGKERARAERCLANAIYFEARSEPVRGQMAVAQVVVNRAFSGFYPNDICGVVYQNAGRHLACQFTFACDGKSKAINERGQWVRANRIAKQTLDGQIYVPEVAKSTHYHAVYVHPNWVGEMKKMVRYGVHNFYRPYAWGNGDEEPVWGSGVASAKKN
jgi:hypothetical protein